MAIAHVGEVPEASSMCYELACRWQMPDMCNTSCGLQRPAVSPSSSLTFNSHQLPKVRVWSDGRCDRLFRPLRFATYFRILRDIWDDKPHGCAENKRLNVTRLGLVAFAGAIMLELMLIFATA
jgi:hypothetical protein